VPTTSIFSSLALVLSAAYPVYPPLLHPPPQRSSSLRRCKRDDLYLRSAHCPWLKRIEHQHDSGGIQGGRFKDLWCEPKMLTVPRSQLSRSSKWWPRRNGNYDSRKSCKNVTPGTSVCQSGVVLWIPIGSVRVERNPNSNRTRRSSILNLQSKDWFLSTVRVSL